MDKRTETLLDKVAEEWVIARKKLEDRDPKIKENDVEMIEAIKTIVVEANIWHRFIRENESGGKSHTSRGKGSGSDKPTEKQIDWLSKHGVDSTAMTKKEASIKIDGIIKSEDGNGEGAWF